MTDRSKVGRDIFTDSSKGLPYCNVHEPRKVRINPGDEVRPFAEIDRLLQWWYNPKCSWR
jgi:hypothetical protein